MSTARQKSVLWRFAQRPPKLDGDIELSVELTDDQHGVIRLRQGEVAIKLSAAGLSVPYPSGLRQLLAREPDVDLIVVERAPPGLRDAAEQAGLSYLDVNGRGRVVAAGLVYVASPDPADRVEKLRSSPFAPKASRVVRTLLNEPQNRWRLSDVAVLSDLNPGNVHRVLAALIDRGIVERDEDAYLVADPGSLLEAWADQHQQPAERIVVQGDGGLEDCVRALIGKLDGKAVVSGELAAEELAPYLPAETAIIHCLDAERFAALASKDEPSLAFGVLRGQVVVDLADEGYGAFRSERKGLPLATAAQIYVDLAADRGRGREAAEHLRREALRF
jgi:hypothetical protein